jgi:hypothetical protein
MSHQTLNTDSDADILGVPAKPPFRWRRWFIALALSVASLALLFHLTFNALLPFEQRLGSEPSPDGALTAEYSWRPHGIIGLITTDNAMLYLTIRDTRNGSVISRQEFWGDLATLNEAKERFYGKLPWQPSKESQ